MHKKKGVFWKATLIIYNPSDIWQGNTSAGGIWEEWLNFDFYIFTDCLAPKFLNIGRFLEMHSSPFVSWDAGNIWSKIKWIEWLSEWLLVVLFCYGPTMSSSNSFEASPKCTWRCHLFSESILKQDKTYVRHRNSQQPSLGQICSHPTWVGKLGVKLW